MKRTIERCNADTDNRAPIAKCRHTPQRKKTDTKLSPPCTVSGLANGEQVESALWDLKCSSRLHHIYRQFRNAPFPHIPVPLGATWSPDGSNILARSSDHRLWVFAPPDGEENLNPHYTSVSSDDSFVASHVIRVAAYPYDVCWHPRMSKSDPRTCVFASCCFDQPLHLWDATTGQVRATYRADKSGGGDFSRIRTCYSIAFNPDGDRMYAGHIRLITPFYLNRPGKYTTQNARTILPRSERDIVSAMACSPSSPHVLAAGSGNGNIAICALNNLNVLQIIPGHENGVTQVQFSPDGRYLYSVAQKEEIVCWDVRQSYKVVCKFYRPCRESGHPPIWFDVDHAGQHLGTGAQDGCVYIYETQTGNIISKFQAALDTVNGFSFHPSQPLAVTSSGYSRFYIGEDRKHSLSEYENCLSVWDLRKGFQP